MPVRRLGQQEPFVDPEFQPPANSPRSQWYGRPDTSSPLLEARQCKEYNPNWPRTREWARSTRWLFTGTPDRLESAAPALQLLLLNSVGVNRTGLEA